jgi:hypothetical protein
MTSQTLTMPTPYDPQPPPPAPKPPSGWPYVAIGLVVGCALALGLLAWLMGSGA